jgi:predicted HTH domain antitoxin
MPVTTIRLNKKDLRYLDDLAKKHELDRTNLIKKAITLGVHEILIEEAIENYQKGIFTVWQCARDARISLWEFIEVLKTRGIHFRTDETELENALKELE